MIPHGFEVFVGLEPIACGGASTDWLDWSPSGSVEMLGRARCSCSSASAANPAPRRAFPARFHRLG